MGLTTPDRQPPPAGSDPRRQAEELLKQQDLPGDPAMSPEVGRLLHELRVHKIQLEMQNEELKSAEEELAASREAYVELFDHAPVGYLTLDGESVVRRANLTSARLLGVTREDLVGAPLTRFITSDDQDIYYLHRRRLLATGEPQTCELRLRRGADGATGELIWARLEGRPQPLSDAPLGCWVALTDVTVRHQAEEAMRESEARFRGYFEQGLVGVAVATALGAFTDANQAACDLLGYSREELLGLNWADLTHPDDRAADVERAWRMAASEIEGYRIEKRFVRKDGAVVLADMSLRCRRAPDGAIEGFLAMFADVTEQRRAEQEGALLKHSVDVHRDGAYWMDEDSRFVYVNDAACAMLGYAREALVGRHLSLVNPDADAATIQRLWERLRAQGSFVVESRHRRKDGSELPVEISSGYVSFAGREYICGFATDITERKRTEAELRESEARYRLLAENVSDVVFEVAGGGVRWISPSVTALSGWLPEQLLGQPAAALVHPDDLPHLAAYRENGPRGAHDRVDVRLRFASGEYHWLSMELHTVVGPSGEPTLIGSGRDIQAEVETRAALAESEHRYRALSEGSPDFIFVFDRALRVLYMNSTSARAFGRTQEEIVGAALEDLFDRETAAAMSASQRTVFESGETRHTETNWRGPWGQKWLATWLVPIHDAAGEVEEVFGVSRDITVLKRAEGELAAANAELEQRVAERTAELRTVNDELEAFAYAVSHDLRAPLRAIDGFSHILVEDEAEALSDAGRENLVRVRAAAQRMGVLIDALLALSRLSRKQLDVGRVDLSRLAIEIVARLREQDPERHVEVRIARDCKVTSDADLLEVVLSNLLANAWKFTSRREEAQIEFGETTVDGEHAFFVRDDGAGFEPAYVGKLFQPFQRLHAADEFPGTGIGLATVKRIVARLGGRCWAEGAEGQGATFYFTLPEPVAGA